jgi:hypothetical protein
VAKIGPSPKRLPKVTTSSFPHQVLLIWAGACLPSAATQSIRPQQGPGLLLEAWGEAAAHREFEPRPCSLLLEILPSYTSDQKQTLSGLSTHSTGLLPTPLSLLPEVPTRVRTVGAIGRRMLKTKGIELLALTSFQILCPGTKLYPQVSPLLCGKAQARRQT